MMYFFATAVRHTVYNGGVKEHVSMSTIQPIQALDRESALVVAKMLFRDEDFGIIQVTYTDIRVEIFR